MSEVAIHENVLDVEAIDEERISFVVTSRWGFEGVFLDPYLAEQTVSRLMKGAAYRTDKNPRLQITPVPLNPVY